MLDKKAKEELRKKAFFRKVKREKRIVAIFVILSFALLIWVLSFIFKQAISDGEHNLSNIISLGAIIATFGAALLAVAQVIERDKYDRILRNIDIYYKDISKEKPWRRWQFLNRTSRLRIYNNNVVETTLQNPDVTFDVGSHEIEVYLPTVLEDFYDLPAFECYFVMAKNKKYFLTNAIKTNIDLDGPSGYMGWCCLYDIWKSVMLFRLSRYITKAGILIILSSIMFTVYYILF
ncbi:MAG: hypothetical protein NUK57_08730 [Gudongella sp.]|nr:hypothetical protein [Gudongella sp.]